jgi:hypothetical protein
MEGGNGGADIGAAGGQLREALGQNLRVLELPIRCIGTPLALAIGRQQLHVRVTFA